MYCLLYIQVISIHMKCLKVILYIELGNDDPSSVTQYYIAQNFGKVKFKWIYLRSRSIGVINQLSVTGMHKQLLKEQKRCIAKTFLFMQSLP